MSYSKENLKSNKNKASHFFPDHFEDEKH